MVQFLAEQPAVVKTKMEQDRTQGIGICGQTGKWYGTKFLLEGLQ